MKKLIDTEVQTLGFEGMVTYNFLEAGIIRLLSDVHSEDDLRQIRQRGLKAFETISGKKVKVGSLELTRATLGLGLMLSLVDEEFAVIDSHLKEIRALMTQDGE